MSHMKNCVVCGEPATLWTGHIHTNMGTIGAGHCDAHHNSNGTGQIAGCDSPNPDSCYGWRELADTELEGPLSDEYITTVRGSMQIVKRSEYHKTDEARVRSGKVGESLLQRLFGR